MGSWFSSPDRISVPAELIAQVEGIKDEMRAVHELECATRATDDEYCIRDLAYESLNHYNANHQGAKFRFPAQPARAISYISLSYPPTKDMKAACVGFRKDLWYHLNFSACPCTGDDRERTFFAELCYDSTSCHGLIVKTCTILEEKRLRSSSCAMCPDESKILHPDDEEEFVCGKEGHEREFFSERCEPDGTNVIFSRSEMLETPFLLGGQTPWYRLVED